MKQKLTFPEMPDNMGILDAKKMITGVIDEMEGVVNAYESWLSSAAVKYGVSVSIGDYGSGKFVAKDEETARCFGVEVGEWVHSSQTC